MKKKYLQSIAISGVIALIIAGCGGGGSSSSSSGAGAGLGGGKGTLVGTTFTCGSNSAVTDSNGYTTIICPSGTTLIESTLTGIDVSTGLTPTNIVRTDSTLLDEDGIIIANAFTTAAVASGESNLTAVLQEFADKADVNLTEILQVFTLSSDDSELEKLSKVVIAQVEKMVTDGNATSILTVMDGAIDGNLTSLITELNNSTGILDDVNETVTAVEDSTVSATVFSDLVADDNYTSANITAAKSDTANLIQNTIVADTDTTKTGSFSASTISVLDTNGTVSITKSSNDTNESGKLVISLENLATSGLNENALYSAELTNLTVTKDSSGKITNLQESSNTSLVITANSNTSTTLSLTGSDVNATELLSTYGFITADGGSGMDLNITGFTTYVTSALGTGEDEAGSANVGNGNFTSGMEASGTFGLEVLLNINDNNISSSDQTFTLDTAAIIINGSQTNGWKVIDANLTK